VENYGARYDKINLKGFQPIDTAIKNNFPDIYEYLLDLKLNEDP
jgi:hypothetical protein